MKSSWQSMASQAMFVFLLLCILALMGDSARQSARRRKNFVNARSTLECHRREYTFKAVNREESSGTMCSDYITVESCWGRCNSGEVIKRIKFQCAQRIPLKCNFSSWQIADYHFPFKKAFHFVCMHGDSKKAFFELKDCDPGAPSYLRHYEVTVAKTCACRLCETSQANCETAYSWESPELPSATDTANRCTWWPLCCNADYYPLIGAATAQIDFLPV